jgi:hypothetical protein
MDDDAPLSQIVSTIQKTQLAFQKLLHSYRAAHGPDDSQDLLALDVAMQALGTIVEILDGINDSGGQLDLVQWVLRAPAVPSVEGHDISITQALIQDMRNLEQRLINVNRQIITDGVTRLLPEEATSVRRMVEKYHSIITKVSTGQNLCVIRRQ